MGDIEALGKVRLRQLPSAAKLVKADLGQSLLSQFGESSLSARPRDDTIVQGSIALRPCHEVMPSLWMLCRD